MSYILAIDQGTTGTRAMVFNKNGVEIANAYLEHKQYYPQAGWVEHDPLEIWENTKRVIKQAIEQGKLDCKEIAGIGITNQRETVVAWDKETGKPIHNAIVWQCRRTADFCTKLKEEGYSEVFRQKTGLVCDPYFSGSKIHWLLNNVQKAQQLLNENKLAIGTVDAWLIYNLTGEHITDYSNASRTLMLDIKKGEWDTELLELLKLPEDILSALPELRPSSDKETYGETKLDLFSTPIPVSGAAGDQQAALFGQNCFKPGMVKNTYGTGNFMLQNTGEEIVLSENGLLSTIAWKIGDRITYALEGSVFITGALLNWLKNGLGILDDVKKTTSIMEETPDTQGVYLVPAFVGLGAPHWDSYARGLIIGLTQATTRNHIIRAGLESIVYQSQDVLDAMIKDSGKEIPILRVDGGVTNCEPMLQFQADISQTIVQRPKVNETTALGAAYLAGLAVGYWDNLHDIEQNFLIDLEFKPKMNPDKKAKLLDYWHLAVERAKRWVK
ncbi:MAG: glycerol kinase GlpK [Candidatus Heimdallarchaeaceae archaeon]